MHDPTPAPRISATVWNALRERCPRCGQGDVFAATRGLTGADVCEPCGWRFVRCEGHWIGGAEINLFATFIAGVIVLGAGVFVFGNALWVHALGALFVIAFAIKTRRRCRALFYAIDYLIDPTPDISPPPRGFDDDEDRPDPPSPPSTGRPTKPGRAAVAFIPRDQRERPLTPVTRTGDGAN